MQDQNTNPTTTSDPVAAATQAVSQAAQGDFIKKIVEKIKNSENILIALSRDPSVDELAGAIGLAIFLDGIQKHTTAIYSGRTPDNLAFLQPEETFETNTDSLQDFIISLDKSKADHLRYKLEGDYVKVFITPYKSTITEDDLSFSHGDYNVDFVIALNVNSAGNLDRALQESSRITRDAAVVNITTGDPGRFGEIEWSNPTASSVCEMLTNLIFEIQESDEKPLEHDVATSLLAGIVAATDRFSNNRTNPDTLGTASKLMSMGADQQLITANISGNDIVHNEDDYSYGPKPAAEVEDHSNLEIDHDKSPSNSSNPAARIAPELNFDATSTPTGNAINNTNAVAPESVIVQPIIPGANAASPSPTTSGPDNPAANTNNGTPAQPPLAAPTDPNQIHLPTTPSAPANPSPAANTPSTPATPAANTPGPSQMQLPAQPVAQPASPNAAPVSQMQIPTPPAETTTANTKSTSRPIMNEAPTPPATKQVGPSLTPPAPTHKEPKNYAEMMEAALAEGESAPADPNPATMNPSTITPGPSSAAPTSPTTSSMNPTSQPAPVQSSDIPAPAPSTPIMEPVANTISAPVLPPPPTPNADMNSMMPPILPTVQVPPQMTQ